MVQMNALHRPLACTVHYIVFIYNQKKGWGGGGGEGGAAKVVDLEPISRDDDICIAGWLQSIVHSRL